MISIISDSFSFVTDQHLTFPFLDNKQTETNKNEVQGYYVYYIFCFDETIFNEFSSVALYQGNR